MKEEMIEQMTSIHQRYFYMLIGVEDPNMLGTVVRDPVQGRGMRVFA